MKAVTIILVGLFMNYQAFAGGGEGELLNFSTSGDFSIKWEPSPVIYVDQETKRIELEIPKGWTMDRTIEQFIEAFNLKCGCEEE